MREELDNKLCKKYPEIFKDRHASMNHTCMCWGFSHDDGWYTLIDQLCSFIMWHCEHYNWNIEESKYDKLEPPVAVQVKEKLGQLRFYYRGGDKTIENSVAHLMIMFILGILDG
jgi:hypothetical protein